MTINDIHAALVDSLRDLQLSRGERRALDTMTGATALSDHDRNVLRAKTFELARNALQQAPQQAGDVLNWLEEALKVVQRNQVGGPIPSQAFFSPGDACVNQINEQLRSAKATIDICVFTITDNRITEEIQAAHQRGVRLRIVSDNDKANDAGSDIARLAALGVPIRIDDSPFHMHHKFAIFDAQVLLNGSYNWTLGAARDNEENLIVTADKPLLADFQRVFDALWGRFAGYGNQLRGR